MGEKELFQEAREDAVWRGIGKEPFFQGPLKRLREMADGYLAKPPRCCVFSEMIRYRTDGNRSGYEALLTEHRGRLSVFAMLTLTGGAQADIRALEDTIWLICDEFSWAFPASFPAHLTEEQGALAYPRFIDIYAAETAFALSEILFLLEEKLSPMVVRRAKEEIRRRILEPFLEEELFYWENWNNNWTAVCAGGVGAAFLYLADPDEMNRAMPRIRRNLDRFLSGFFDDGCCMEGYGYWQYGFGFFTCFAELLRQYTDGAEDYFQLSKVRKIARFQQRIRLKDDRIIGFSDSGSTLRQDFGLSCFLSRRYPEVSVPPPAFSQLPGEDPCYRWCRIIRLFVWGDPSLCRSGEPLPAYDAFSEAQWYVRREKAYCLAAKGGTNCEPHNHNDVGGFQLCAGVQDVVSELGAGEYDAAYFDDVRRYDSLCASSRGHSVPIIDGAVQRAGEQFRAVSGRIDAAAFEVELAAAYDVPALRSFVRRFEAGKTRVTLTDRFVFDGDPLPVTERIVSLSKPVEVEPGCVRIGAAQLCYDSGALSLSITRESYRKGAGVTGRANILELRPTGIGKPWDGQIKLEFAFEQAVDSKRLEEND